MTKAKIRKNGVSSKFQGAMFKDGHGQARTGTDGDGRGSNVRAGVIHMD